jgi:RNA polymerase sigma-70 factor (ECF subfamily)
MSDFRDPKALADAYRQHGRRAFAAANAVLRDEAAAEEVVQDVFMQLWNKPHQFDPDRASLGTFVSMMAHRRALDRWRSRRAMQGAIERTAREQQVVTVRSEKSAADPVIAREEAREAVKALRRLPRHQREALVLAYGKGLTAREIARATGVPLGTAKSRVRLGLQNARMQLEAA